MWMVLGAALFFALEVVVLIVLVRVGIRSGPPAAMAPQQSRWADYQLLQQVRGAVEVYTAQHGTAPPTLWNIRGSTPGTPPVLDMDWRGNPLIYSPAPTSDGHVFELRAVGPDGVAGTPDDVSAWDVPK